MNGRERGRREGGSALAILLAFSLVGCAKHRDRAPKKDETKKPAVAVESAGFGAGYTTVYQTADPESPPSFSLNWKQGGFDAKTGAVDYGHLVEPAGQIFQDGKASSTYRSDTGDAVRETKRLNMDGHVVLQTIDRKETLRAPHGEYRGDVRLVRATGGVAADGTFGTLSGVPELWATPDLRLIGTPDMIVKTLKLPALAALAATAATGHAKLQRGNDVLTDYGPFKIVRVASGTRVTASPIPGKGPMLLTMPERGLVFRLSGPVVVDLDAKAQVRHMTAEGKVNVVQTKPDGTNTMDGIGAEYDARPNAETATLDVGGRVTLTTVAKGKGGTQTTTSRGDQGRAILVNRPAAGEDALRGATLTGNATIDSAGAGGGTFAGTGQRLVYTPRGETTGVDMDGGVVLTRVAKAKDGSTSTTVGKGSRGTATLLSNPSAGASPLKSAVLDERVTIDVDGSNAESYHAAGDRLVYTAVGEGGKAVLTGDLKLSGSATTFIGSEAGANTATLTIGKGGWESVETSNTEGKPGTTTIKLPARAPKVAPSKKGRRGGKP